MSWVFYHRFFAPLDSMRWINKTQKSQRSDNSIGGEIIQIEPPAPAKPRVTFLRSSVTKQSPKNVLFQHSSNTVQRSGRIKYKTRSERWAGFGLFCGSERALSHCVRGARCVFCALIEFHHLRGNLALPHQSRESLAAISRSKQLEIFAASVYAGRDILFSLSLALIVAAAP